MRQSCLEKAASRRLCASPMTLVSLPIAKLRPGNCMSRSTPSRPSRRRPCRMRLLTNVIHGLRPLAGLGRSSRDSCLGLLDEKFVDHLGDQAGPAGLVARAHSRAGVTVEIFVERNIVAPVRI